MKKLLLPLAALASINVGVMSQAQAQVVNEKAAVCYTVQNDRTVQKQLCIVSIDQNPSTAGVTISATMNDGVHSYPYTQDSKVKAYFRDLGNMQRVSPTDNRQRDINSVVICHVDKGKDICHTVI